MLDCVTNTAYMLLLVKDIVSRRALGPGKGPSFARNSVECEVLFFWTVGRVLV